MYQELEKLAESGMYPLHMPGHKRNLQSTPLKGAFRCDITEIDGFDNLHDEKGIILEAEQRANDLYGADYTYFLVNGSTSGVLSAVSAAVPEGGNILAARGSHRSFYNAVYLRRLEVEYLKAKMIQPYGIYDSSLLYGALWNAFTKTKVRAVCSIHYQRNPSFMANFCYTGHIRAFSFVSWRRYKYGVNPVLTVT